MLDPCPQEGRYEPCQIDGCLYGNGTHRIVAYNYKTTWVPPNIVPVFIAYEVFDYTVNDPEL